MKKYLNVVTLSILAIIVTGVIVFTVFNKVSVAKELKTVEIRQYKGEKLSSAADFRENSIKGPQHVDSSQYRLVVDGLVGKPGKYSYRDLLNFPSYQKVLTLHCVEGWDVTILWEGILIQDLLKKAIVNPKAKVVIFYAVDGYSTSLPLDYITKNKIIMADKMNGATLREDRGFPFQLVAEAKWGYKWIKWINRIELSDNEKFRGYWESRGYSNDAGLKQDFLQY